MPEKTGAAEHSDGHSDDELLRRIRAGDAEAFTTIYRRYHGRAYRFALHMSGSRTVADDVTQEVFMTLIEHRCGFDSSRGSTLGAYLLGIAKNQTLRRLQNDRAYVPELEESVRTGGPSNKRTPTNLMVLPADRIREERIDLVREAVLSLPPDYRAAVVLCDLQETSYEEAAKIMDCPVGTVRSRLHRARSLLMEKLRDLHMPKKRVGSGERARSFGS